MFAVWWQCQILYAS